MPKKDKILYIFIAVFGVLELIYYVGMGINMGSWMMIAAVPIFHSLAAVDGLLLPKGEKMKKVRFVSNILLFAMVYFYYMFFSAMFAYFREGMPM